MTDTNNQIENEEIIEDTATNDENIEEIATEATTEEQDVTVEDKVVDEVSEIEKLKTENAELKDKVLRQMAEFDNFRKRTIKEKSSMYTDGITETVEKLLPVIDNFDRAITSAPNKEDNFFKGVEMINKQFNEILTSLGVVPIEAVGKEFDANLHFAVQHEENPDFGENTICEEMQKGYMYKEKVIRPSMVKVAN